MVVDNDHHRRYGDHFPVTTEGRMAAVALMAVGVGLFGTLSGMAAPWFTAPTTGTSAKHEVPST